QIRAEPEHALADALLLGDAVILHLQPERPREGRGEPAGARRRRLVVPLPQVQCDLAREAGGETGEALAVALQDLAVDARAPVEPFEEPDRGQLDQVLVASAVG